MATEEDPRPEPDIGQMIDLFRKPVESLSITLTGLLALALLYTIAIAKAFLLPVATAILLSFLLAPLVGWLSSWRLPRPLAAAMVLLSLVFAVGGAIYLTLGPAQEWLGQAPRNLGRIESKLRKAIKPVEQMGAAAAQVERITTVGQDSESEVTVKDKESLGASLFAGTQTLLVSATIVAALLYFLLAGEDLFLRKLVRVLPRLQDQKRAVEIARRIQRDVSVHLSTITLINCVLGVVVGVAMYVLGLPNPVLWGVMAAVFNYVPYLGAVMGILIVAGVALLAMDEVSTALLVPVVYGLITGIEGSLVTPAVLGKRLSLNPVVVFLGIFFWGWIWGIPGALIAVPMLLSFKVFCDYIPPLAPIGEFLGR